LAGQEFSELGNDFIVLDSSPKALDEWISGIEFDKVKDCVGLRQLVKPWDEDRDRSQSIAAVEHELGIKRREIIELDDGSTEERSVRPLWLFANGNVLRAKP
jgi:hypothetical protein